MNIAVIGGGPAGTMVAHHLGKAGVACTLFEKNGAWEKPCGGGVPPKVRELVPEVAAYTGPYNEVTLGEFISPKGKPVLLDTKNPMWIVARKDLGKYLLDLAGSHKSVSVKKLAVKKVSRDKTGFLVHTSLGAQRFDIVVGADGCRSKVRPETIGPIPKQYICMCVGWFVESQGDTKATTLFLPAPGYIWAFPRKDHICIGGGASDPRLCMKLYVKQFIKDFYPDRKLLSKWAAPIPFYRDLKLYDQPACGENWALVGDAAGHVDAVTGEGILYALLGGRFCAEAIISGRLPDYDQRWRSAFGDQLKKAADVSARFYKPEMMDKVFRLAQGSPTMRALLVEIMADQPTYMETGKKFSKLSWKIILETLWDKL